MIRKLRWLTAVAALLAAMTAMPALGAGESPASKPQISRQLVQPWQLSSTERQMYAAWLAADGSSGSSSSHVGRDVGVALGAAAALAVALLMVAGSTRRRHRLAPA